MLRRGSSKAERGKQEGMSEGGGANQKLALEQWFLITKINACNYTHIRLGMYVCVLYKTHTYHITYMCLAVF